MGSPLPPIALQPDRASANSSLRPWFGLRAGSKGHLADGDGANPRADDEVVLVSRFVLRCAARIDLLTIWYQPEVSSFFNTLPMSPERAQSGVLRVRLLGDDATTTCLVGEV